MTGDSPEKIILQYILPGHFWIARIFLGDLNNLHRGTETGIKLRSIDLLKLLKKRNMLLPILNRVVETKCKN